MFKIACSILIISFSFLAIAPALQGTCKLCEDIRERNREHPSSGYTFYEDYLKAQGNEDQGEGKQPESDSSQKGAAPKNHVRATTPNTPQS
ncbi:MAG: hypothetical protein H0U49_07155 [Parachlamydiaceae bacterium]|nr:hypothetical protein [Parachlamydiaceae bacterium]